MQHNKKYLPSSTNIREKTRIMKCLLEIIFICENKDSKRENVLEAKGEKNEKLRKLLAKRRTGFAVEW